ncbi:pyridine nucleotide-disulfide oxidoreductase, partial [Spirillospora sp. NPDC049652]
ERSVGLDVHRMATRRRRDRELLTVRLEECLEDLRRALTTETGTAVTGRALRFAVNKAAMTRLNDLSVTPRDLRARLRLDEPPE